MGTQRTETTMRARHFGLILVVALVALGTSGCFTTRVVRDDTTTSYDLVRADHATAAAPTPTSDVAVATATVPPAPGTLVVEALTTPPPAAHPVRLPDSVAGATASHVAVAAAPAWAPLPSYVGQFAGPGWQHRSIFYGSPSSSQVIGLRGRGLVTYPLGGGIGSTSTGAYGSASPHFSSAPSFSGSASSHFAGGAHFSGY